MDSTQLILIIAAVALTLDVLLFTLLPKTRSARVVRTIAKPAPALFARVTDVTQAPSWVPACSKGEVVSGRNGPARRQALHYANGVTAEQQVTTWVDDRQYGWKETPVQGPLAEARTVFTLTERGAETEVEILGEWTARSIFAKLYANFGHPAVVKRTFDGMLDNLDSQ